MDLSGHILHLLFRQVGKVVARVARKHPDRDVVQMAQSVKSKWILAVKSRSTKPVELPQRNTSCREPQGTATSLSSSQQLKGTTEYRGAKAAVDAKEAENREAMAAPHAKEVEKKEAKTALHAKEEENREAKAALHAKETKQQSCAHNVRVAEARIDCEVPSSSIPAWDKNTVLREGEEVRCDRTTESEICKEALPRAFPPAPLLSLPRPTLPSLPSVFTSHAATSRSHASLRLAQLQVVARYLATKIGATRTAWFRGKVTAVYKDSTVDILYSDGDIELGVVPWFVRPASVMKAQPGELKTGVETTRAASVSSGSFRSLSGWEAEVNISDAAHASMTRPMVLPSEEGMAASAMKAKFAVSLSTDTQEAALSIDVKEKAKTVMPHESAGQLSHTGHLSMSGAPTTAAKAKAKIAVSTSRARAAVAKEESEMVTGSSSEAISSAENEEAGVPSRHLSGTSIMSRQQAEEVLAAAERLRKACASSHTEDCITVHGWRIKFTLRATSDRGDLYVLPPNQSRPIRSIVHLKQHLGL